MNVNVETIKTVIKALLGGSAEPIGSTQVDEEKFIIQKMEEDLIDWLINDMYKCLDKEDVYWASGQVSGKRARSFLTDLYEELGEMLKETENEAD